MYVRPLSTYVHSHVSDPEDFPPGQYDELAAIRQQKATEKSVRDLPHNYQCWVLTALRKKYAEQRHVFRKWKRHVGLGHSVELKHVQKALERGSGQGGGAGGGGGGTVKGSKKESKKHLVLGGTQYSEEEMILLSDFVHDSAAKAKAAAKQQQQQQLLQQQRHGSFSGDNSNSIYEDSLFAKLVAVSHMSRSGYIAALAALKITTYSPYSLIIPQDRPTSTSASIASQTLLEGGVRVVKVPRIMLDTEVVQDIYDLLDSPASDGHPKLTHATLGQLQLAGDVSDVSQYASFGEISVTTPDTELAASTHPAFYIASTACTIVTLDRHNYKNVSRTQSTASELQSRVSFLKTSQLFPTMPHSEIVSLAGLLTKETYTKNELLCRNGEVADCFFFILSGEVLCQYYPPTSVTAEASNPRAGSPDGKQASLMLRPSHETNIILKHSCVLSEDVLVSNSTHDVTAICHSASCDVLKVPRAAWDTFRPLTVASRVIALIYKDRLSTDQPLKTLSGVPTIHNRFTSIRSILSQTRPHRAKVDIFDYTTAEFSRARDAMPSTTSGNVGGGGGFVDVAPLGMMSATTPKSKQGFPSLSTPGSRSRSSPQRNSLFSSDESSVTSSASGLSQVHHKHSKLDGDSVAHLGDAVRKALLVKEDQKRIAGKELAGFAMNAVKKKRAEDFEAENEVTRKMDLQYINPDRTASAKEFIHAMQEVRAAVILAATGAVAIEEEAADAEDGMKNLIGELFFGGDREPTPSNGLSKLKKSLGKGTMGALKTMKSFGGSAFKAKLQRSEVERKSWSSEVERGKKFKAKREERIMALRDMIASCDEAMEAGFGDGGVATYDATGEVFFDYTMAEKKLLDNFDDLVRNARLTAERMEKELIIENRETKRLADERKKMEYGSEAPKMPSTPYWKDTERYKKMAQEKANRDVEREMRETEEEEKRESETEKLALLEKKKKKKKSSSRLLKSFKGDGGGEGIAALVAKPEVVDKPEEKVVAAKAVIDPHALIQKKARAGWGNLKAVATTHLEEDDKNDEGVKKMLMSTVRAVKDDGSKGKGGKGGDIDPVEALLAQEEQQRKDAEEREAMAQKWNRPVPNATYFKAAAVSDTRKSRFLNFDAVLGVDAEGLRGALVKPDEVLRTSVGRIKEARLMESGGGGGKATSLRAGVLSSVNGVVNGGGGSKRLSDLEEWQIYHVERCLEEKDKMRSLPNLNGHHGKFKLVTRAPPGMLKM
jgi:CRP-like cAMP-binding protein